jgi:cytosine/adenosine deaminase-related metal-dependent hydrolase
MITVLSGCAVVTMDRDRTEYRSGYLVVDGARIVAVGNGPAPFSPRNVRYVDATGCLLTPGLINTHQHLYQWVTRGLAADEKLFDWLRLLYPVWASMDEGIVHAASLGGLAWLARTGCTTTADHHYVFPAMGGDVLGATIEAAREVGMRFHPTRGSMDLGRSAGGPGRTAYRCTRIWRRRSTRTRTAGNGSAALRSSTSRGSTGWVQMCGLRMRCMWTTRQ